MITSGGQRTASDEPGGLSEIVAVAAGDPLHPRTFSGYSYHLFTNIQEAGVRVLPLSSRDLRWYDMLTGAVAISSLLRRRDRYRPVIRPDWYWSRSGFERFSLRFDQRLSRIAPGGILLQVGTHVSTSLPATRSFCVTDTTVVQALAAGQFSISRASPRVAAEAIDCQRQVFHSCEKVFVLSRWAADSVIGDYGYPKDRTVVIGAGVNVSDRRTRSVDQENPFILFVGLDWEQKGGPLILDAFRIVRRQHANARLKVVGCRPAIREEGVDIIGYLDTTQPDAKELLLRLYAGASCFALASVFDAFPNVLLEAAYMGVPVVSIREGSRPEAVMHEVTGLLIEERQPEALAKAITRLLDDPGYAGELGEAGRRRVEAQWTWPKVAARVLAEMAAPNRDSTKGSSDPLGS